MKYLGLIAILCAALTFAACGSDNSPPDSRKPEAKKPAETKLTKPHIQPPSGPPPKELVVRDLKEGSGPPTKAGDEMTVEYLAVDKTGKKVFSSWDKSTPLRLTFQLGAGDYFPGWDKGLTGMKVGGRRELIFPSKLTRGFGALFYVIDLLEIN